MCREENDMGLYIPNMEMPKTCFSCSFNDGIFCALIDNDTDAFIKETALTSRLPNCPLIEIDLVRCGECKHWYRNNPPIDEECDMLPNADDFCPYGERRTDDR